MPLAIHRQAALARWSALVVLLVAISPLEAKAVTPGTVYLVLGSDAAVWNRAGGVNVAEYHNHFVPDVYTVPGQNGYRVMDPGWRASLTDSFGQPLKLTWWMLMGSVYALADNTDVPLRSLMPMYLMRKYHGDAIRQFGDEISLHYHTFFWSDYDGDGVFYWNQSRTFAECRTDFDLTLAQSLLEEEMYPASFRSGWHYMDNEWQSYLNVLIPYSLHNASPIILADGVEPYSNVYDWSKAAVEWVPFRPATTNYQLAGDGAGWNVRSMKFPGVTQAIIDQMFAQAAGGTDQVACLWAHIPETDFLAHIERINIHAHLAASNYPTVKFRYCTAVEAMQRWRGMTNSTPLELTVTAVTNGESVTLTLQTSEAIFQVQPFVALKNVFEDYSVLSCVNLASNTWRVSLPEARSRIAKVGIAVTDLAGNVVTRVIRFLPDDLYLDNLDAPFATVQGDWRSTNVPGLWGANLLVAALQPGSEARARWTLPISNAGPQRVFVRVPLIDNAASNITFSIYADGSNLLTQVFPQRLPANTWVQMGTIPLDPTQSNSLEMSVNGTDQTNALAIADVIKISPLMAKSTFISRVQTDPGDTTANIVWSTTTPATTSLRYGTDLNYGSFAQTNSLLLRNHVVTISPLTASTTYYFEAQSVASGTQFVARGYFSTGASNSAPPHLRLLRSDDVSLVYWNGRGFKLQQAPTLNSPMDWMDVPGTITDGPYAFSNEAMIFFRLIEQ